MCRPPFPKVSFGGRRVEPIILSDGVLLSAVAKTTRTIGGVRGLPRLPDVDESKVGLLVYVLLALLAIGVLAFGPDNGFIVQDFPYP